MNYYWMFSFFLHCLIAKIFIQDLESMKRGITDSQPQNNVQQLSSQFQDGLKLDSLMHSSETEVCNFFLSFGI